MSGNPNRFPHDRRPHQAQSQGTKLYQTASSRPNNGAAPPTNVTSAAPSLNTFSFRPQSTGTALYTTTGSASKAFESVGKGGLRFDLKQQPQKQQQQPQQHQRSSSNSNSSNSSTDLERMAKRAERFGTTAQSTTPKTVTAQPQPKKQLYKPEPGSLLTPKGGDVASNSDFISFDGMDGFGDEEDDLTAQDKKKMEDDSKKFRDRDPLDLVYDLPRPVWANRQYSSDLRLMFNQEVQDYVHYISPTPAEHSIRHLTIERLRFVVAKLWPHATVQVFGSFSTKLYLPTSDVDIVIMSPRLKTPACLFELSVALRDHKYVSKIEVIAKARVPIIKYVDALTTFPVDISINMDSGPQAAQIVTHFLQEPNGVGEAIRGLMYLLKQFLLARHLNEPFSGGCGSYALLILVASFVKMHPLIQIGALEVKENLGILFMEFLELYGRSFSYFDVGIMCDLKDGVGYFSKHNYYPAPGKRVLMLTALDPQDKTNDVGCGAFNFQYIKTEFFRASQKLVAILGAGEKRHYDSLRRLKPHQRHHSPRPPPSILSAVVSVRKGLYEYRRGIADLWRRVESGEVGTGVEEDVWNQVCEGLKQYEQERRSLAPKKRSREAEEGEVISSRESVVPVQPDSSPAEPQAKKVHLVGYDSEEEVDGLKMSKEEKERRDWKLWEKEYFNVLQEAKDELGASDVSLSDMEVSSGEEGEISNKPRKKQVVEVEVEERKGDSRNPLKKK